MSIYRDTLDELVTDLTTNVPGLVGVRTYPTEPIMYPAQEPSLASWFDFEEVLEEGPTGARHIREFYWLRYWESAPWDEQQVTADPAESEALEDLFLAVKDRLFRVAAQSFGGASPLWIIRARTGLGSLYEAAFTRGWEIYLSALRFHEFSE